jgi:galactokinase
MRSRVVAERLLAAFAPGRVNLIGEHTDYNRGLALAFAIEAGVTVTARAAPTGSDAGALVRVEATDVGERDEMPLLHPERADGWRAFVRGVVAELAAAGFPLRGGSLRITGEVPAGAGLSSSAALEVALALALIELGCEGGSETVDRIALARLCSRVENEWVGARTGLLDQLASLCGRAEAALLIDFDGPALEHVPLRLGDWTLAVLDSGEAHAHARSGYNERRAECSAACRLLGIDSLREASEQDIAGLPEPLDRRVAHVLGENRRVDEAVTALRAADLTAIGRLLDESHVSLRELYDSSTPSVERAVRAMHEAGAAGARMVGGGFGGSVLAIFAPGVSPPQGARGVRPGPGARLLPAAP